MRDEVTQNLSQQDSFHREWVSKYREGVIGTRLNRIMDRLFDEARMHRGDHILDAGCGTGTNSARLLARGLKVTAVDFADFAVRETVQALGDQAEVIQGSLTDLPFPDDHFDHVLCSGVLMHIPDVACALGEVVRVLRPGGKLMITEGSDRSAELMLRRVFWKLAGKSHQLVPSPSGLEVWSNGPSGPLLARKLNDRWLKQELARFDVHLSWQGVGFLSDLFLTFRSPLAMKLIVASNDLWFRMQPKTRLTGDMLYVFCKADG